MFRRRFQLTASLYAILLGSLLSLMPAPRPAWAQQPTGSIPTVTSSPSGPMVTPKTGAGAENEINVRAGPGREYVRVGVLVIGQYASALGRSSGGDWILIAYPGAPDGTGWVYSPNVDIIPLVDLPIIEPPPTPTPRVTPTIDPTLAAQFIVEIPATRLPTFTAPPPLALPTFVAFAPANPSAGLPMGFLIIGMGVVGLFGALISLLRGR